MSRLRGCSLASWEEPPRGASTTYIAGNSYNTPANLAAWIRRPDSVEPGTVMPMLETATGRFGPPRLLPPSLLQSE